MMTAAMKFKRSLLLGRKAMTNLDGILKSRDITLPTKVHLVKAMVFPIIHVWIWELDHKEGWVPKNWYFQTVVLEKTLESPLDCKEIQPVNPKGNLSWIFTGRTDAEARSSNTLSTLCEELTHLKRPWCKKRLKAGGEGDNKGQDGWMAQWMWVSASSGTQWWTGRPGMLQSMGLPEVGHDWATEQEQNACLVTSVVSNSCDPKGCSPPGSVHGILQARILKWVAMPSSRRSSQTRDWTQVSRFAGGSFTIWATREAQEWLKEMPHATTSLQPQDLPH